MSGARILVTGATGFVGRALTAHLLAHRRDLVAAVRNRSAVLAEGAARAVVGDIDADTDWRGALDGVDAVVHLAARVHVMDDRAADPLAEFRRLNVDATLNLARQALHCGVRRFVFVSSIGVNGAESLTQPYSEASAPHPHSPYAVSKLEAELALAQLCRDSAMELVLVRPPLIYGAGAPGNFGMLIKVIRKGIPFPLASVANRRSMIFIDNFVDFIEVCLDHPAAAGQVFLVADEEPVSTPALIRLLAAGLERPPRLIRFPVALLRMAAQLAGKRSMHQQLCGSLVVDVSKARTLLGWVPAVSVQDGLRSSAKAYVYEKSV